MSRVRRPVVTALAALILFGLAAGAVTRFVAAGPVDRPAQWRKVVEAERKGLPQTAIKEVQPIIDSALADKAYPEAIKAIVKKSALEGTIQGNKPEEQIVRMKAAIAAAPPEMVPVMDAVLAHWYWHYFQQNRWRIVQRTTTAAPVGDDVTTWDLPRVLAEIDARMTKALANEKVLKATPIKDYDALLSKGALPDAYRPTLFDFLAFEALDFYAAGEQAGAKVEDTFEVDAGGPAIAPVEQFVQWKPVTTDAGSRTLKAITLYQNLLAFHQNDPDPTALLDADLHRLQFGYNAARGDEKAALYKTALARFADRYAGHELSAVARFRLAAVVHGEGDFVEAKAIAEKAVAAYPESVGGKLAYNLIKQIEAKSVAVATERVWADPLPATRVTYKNLTKIHFRAYRADWAARLGGGRHRPEQLTDADRKQFLARRPDAAFAADLPATPDYHERTENVPAPKGLPKGFYFVFASPDPAFPEANNPIAVTDVWVSDLAVVLRTRGGVQVEGFVLKAESGEPIAGAAVKTWFRDNRNQTHVGPTVETDANGLFRFRDTDTHSWLVAASARGDELAAASDQHTSVHFDDGRPHGQTVFFTDRAIYRPGQVVQFKGICLEFEQGKGDYHVLPNQDVVVVFRDVNGQEVAKLPARSNDYGSFAGSFVAPRDRLTGQMSLTVDRDVAGSTAVSVEEYKRPQFLVTVDAPKEPAKLTADVTVAGRATAYSGAAVGGAQVRYRVVREVRYPPWAYEVFWRMPPHGGAAQEIAHGVATTGADGGFTVTFPAKPDRTVPEKDEPTFSYTVTADVTDLTGETRSGERAVHVGYAALQAELTANTWQTTGRPVTLVVRTRSLDGDPRPAKGTVKVYRLKEPATVQRPDILGHPSQPFPRRSRGTIVPPVPPKPDPSDVKTWDLGDVAATLPFATDGTGTQDLAVKLDDGAFRAVLETADAFGKPVTARHTLTVLAPDAKTFALKVPDLVAAPKWSLEPGQSFTAVWGTGYGRGRAFVEIESRGKNLQAYWTEPGRTQVAISQAVTEAMRGGFTLRVTHVQENRAYLTSYFVSVPWTNKELTVKWERFVSKLQPGQKEKWTAVVTGPDSKKAAAEMVAALYDASLDAFQPHDWPHGFGVFPAWNSNLSSHFQNTAMPFHNVTGGWHPEFKDVGPLTYRAFPADVTDNLWGYQFGRGRMLGAAAPGMAPPGGFGGGFGGFGGGVGGKPEAAMKAGTTRTGLAASGGTADVIRETQDLLETGVARRPDAGPAPDLSKVAARANLTETAFFFPHLLMDESGAVRMEFTMPEALTKWKFLGFAHDKNLRAGFLGGEAVTAKDLMVRPNAPRFLREGDVIEFTVKVNNESADRQSGTVRLTFADARTGQSVDAALGIGAADKSFDIAPKAAQTFAWKLTVPDGLGPITYKAVAAAAKFSDGEEGLLPVLSKRVLVTESIPLPVRGAQTKTFAFDKLRQSGNSATLKTESLTVQMASNPAWYAVMALPYLMEFPHECSEQTFNRLYANALAHHIAGSDPKIRKVFDQWKNTPALDSPLEKNQDLKSVLLEETPWVRAAQSESQARRNVGLLFDDNRLTEEAGRLLRKMADLQHADGAWPWFPGGPPNDYLTLYIMTGYGRLRHLGLKLDAEPAVKATARLDAWADERYRDVLRSGRNKDDNHLSSTLALYLYGRSFFLADRPVEQPHQEAVNYWLWQAKAYWLKLANRQSQAHLALALKRFGDRDTPPAILASIRERAVHSEELGMFWRDTEISWWWYHAPIETQAVMIEAFAEVAGDAKAVEDCKVWLLKQKQTQNWKTTKATADAVYALLLRGTDLLKSDALVAVSLGAEQVRPDKVEAGTGFYEHKYLRKEVTPEMGTITVTKTDPGVAWGSVSWQYLEDVSKVTPHDGTPLKLDKKLFKRVYTKAGPVLEAVAGPVGVGDEIVVRVVLRTDRDMEYVHLKDHRGSGTEPVNVLSKYKYQDGLAYYESTKDAATHFFIDYLPKGTYVFEYPVRVQLKGRYPTGLADIQCMYAPEFNSHSESIMLEVK